MCEHTKFDTGKCDEVEGQQPIADEGTTYCDCEAYESSDKMTDGWYCDGHYGFWNDSVSRRLSQIISRHPDHDELRKKAARRLSSSGHEGETVYDDYGTCLEKNCDKVLASACAETPEIFSLAGQMGVALMIFESGMHFDFEKSRKVGGRSIIIAILGTVLPVICGGALVVAYGYDMEYDAIAAGTALAPTSVGIALKLLHEAKQLQTDHGQVIITAAFVDDILSLILFNLVFSLADGFSIMEVVVKPVLGITFMIVTALLGISFWPSLFAKVDAKLDMFEENNPDSKIQDILFRFSSLETKDAAMFLSQMVLLIGYACVTNLCGTHLWGCFIAGMSFASVDHAHHVWVNQTKRLTVWMLRLFFACSVAFTIPLDGLFNVKAFWQGLIMGVGPCILTKVVCAFFMGPPRFVIGWAMVGRAEFAYLIAQMAYAGNMMSQDVYALTIWALLWATIVAPFVFRAVLERYGKTHLKPLTEEEENALEHDVASQKVLEGMTDMFATKNRRAQNAGRTLSGASIASRTLSGQSMPGFAEGSRVRSKATQTGDGEEATDAAPDEKASEGSEHM